MANDLRTIEELLNDCLRRLRLEAGVAVAAVGAIPEPVSLEERREKAERRRKCDVIFRNVIRLEDALKELREEREKALRAKFAGTWPPTNPLDLRAMRAALIDDFNEIRLIAPSYLGDANDFGEGTGPMGAAFVEVDEALHALKPKTPEAATAIRFAWQEDAAVALEQRWSLRQVRAARKMAWSELPRSR